MDGGAHAGEVNIEPPNAPRGDPTGEHSLTFVGEMKRVKLAATGFAAAGAASLSAIIALVLWADPAKSPALLILLSAICGGALATAVMHGRLGDAWRELSRVLHENRRMTEMNDRLVATIVEQRGAPSASGRQVPKGSIPAHRSDGDPQEVAQLSDGRGKGRPQLPAATAGPAPGEGTGISDQTSSRARNKNENSRRKQ